MPTTRTASRSASRAASKLRTDVLTELKEDHKRVKKAYRDFQKLDASDTETRAAIVDQVLQELTVHASLEEELLYPAARAAVAEEGLIDEAEVEHASMRALIEQLRGMDPEDDKYAARFTVLCEYVLHHVKEEEGEIFPQIERSRRLDWAALGAEMTTRRAELTPEALVEVESEDDASMPSAGRPRSSAAKAAASAASAAARRNTSLD